MRYAMVLPILGLLAACAPITAPSRLELSGNAGGVLLVVQVANAFKPAYQASLLEVALTPSNFRPSVGPGPDPLAAYRHTLNSLKRDERSSTFVLLEPLPAGTYVLQDVRGQSLRFPVAASFQLPVGGTLTVRPGRLTYLGRAEAVNRERRSDQELRAGSLFPVIDQRIAGFANGTFDLVVRDAQAEDFASLQAQLGRVTPDQVDTTLVKVQP